MKYRIRVQYQNHLSTLMHKDKTEFCRRTALKYLREWQANFPQHPAHLEAA